MGFTSKGQRRRDADIVGEEIAQALPQDGKPWWKTWHLLRLNAVIFVVILCSATNGYDGSMMNALQISPAWKEYYDNPQSARLGTINAMFVVGKILGMIFVAPFSNRFGRKLPLILAMMICVAGAGIQAGAVNFGMLVFSRCVLGFGSSLMMLPGPIIIAEMAYPTHRGKLTAMFNVFYYYGAILAAWSTFGTLKLDGDWGWRIPTLLQGATPALQLLFVWFVPESPRFLIAKGRMQEARDIFVYHHAGGDQASPLVEVEMKQIQLNLRQEAESEGVAWSRVLRSPANRKRLLISAITGIASQWAGNAVISYYLTLALDKVGITDATQQAAINGGLQVFNLLAALGFGSLLVDRLGRRVLFLWSAVGMTCSYTALTIVNSRFAATQSKSLGYAFIPMIFLFYFHYNIAMTPLLYAYPPEIWPYHLRTWGTAFTLIIAYASLIIGLFANPVALRDLDWRYYIVFCVINAVFVALVYLFFPETKGKTLEEIAEIFEGSSRGTGALGEVEIEKGDVEYLDHVKDDVPIGEKKE